MKVLLISNKVMHYRVSIYNYFFRAFKKKGYDFSVLTNLIQVENQNKIIFPYIEMDFNFRQYRDVIKKVEPDFVIIFLHLKDKIIWPLVHWLKIRKIPFSY